MKKLVAILIILNLLMLLGCKIRNYDDSGCYAERVNGKLIEKKTLDYPSNDSVKVIVNVMSIEDLELVSNLNINIMNHYYFNSSNGKCEFIIPKGEHLIKFSSTAGILFQKYNFQKSIELDVFLRYSFHTDGYTTQRNFKLNGNVIKKDTSDNTVREIEYRRGLKNGVYLYYSVDGKYICKGFYKKGEMHGLWTYFYDNGNPERITEYNYGNFDGERISFYKNGKVKKIQFYNLNSPIGTWIIYDEQGNLIKQYSFDD